MQQRHWAVAIVLSAVAVCAVVCPLADAAVSRRSEYAADRYAADVGVGPQLAGALQVLAGQQPRRVGLVARLLSRHPQVSRRIEALGAQVVQRPGRRGLDEERAAACFDGARAAGLAMHGSAS
ncbi:M48 family metalloprotease [Jatrophihabitans telluris]|uniref:M48 family metalloprotease n=1 Tax=Jatrophihabitans telluris TaxID=2038343 RepID=A0ABY4QVF3_9ACTN|nr:M48 family metalloprotease [Jatrophihabitans telluris]UQX87648.1 M48 family metalloprotease [Jatrophihabitans telluris]